MVEQPIYNFLVIQPSRSFFNKADDAAKAKAEQAANAEQSEQNVRFFILSHPSLSEYP